MNGQRPHLAGRSGRDGFAGRFIHDVAAPAAVATGQHTAVARPPAPQVRTMVAPRRPPHTVQLCIHYAHRPAGFWVGATGGTPVRRPWCPSCGQHLDPASYHLDPFDSHHGTKRHP